MIENDSEAPIASLGTASLTSFGPALRDVLPRQAFLFVIPRHASAEGPLGLRLGATSSTLPLIPNHCLSCIG